MPLKTDFNVWLMLIKKPYKVSNFIQWCPWPSSWDATKRKKKKKKKSPRRDQIKFKTFKVHIHGNVENAEESTRERAQTNTIIAKEENLKERFWTRGGGSVTAASEGESLLPLLLRFRVTLSHTTRHTPSLGPYCARVFVCWGFLEWE